MLQNPLQSLPVRQAPVVALKLLLGLGRREKREIHLLLRVRLHHARHGVRHFAAGHQRGQQCHRPHPAVLPAGLPQRRRAPPRQQQQGGIDEIEVAPAVVNHRFQGNDHDNRQAEPPQEKDVQATLKSAQIRQITAHQGVCHPQYSQQKRNRVGHRGGDDNPNGRVVPGQRQRADPPPEVQDLPNPAEFLHVVEGREEVLHRCLPQVGPARNDAQHGHHQENGHGPGQPQPGLGFGAAEDGFQRQHAQRHGHEQHAENADVYRGGGGQPVHHRPAQRRPLQQPDQCVHAQREKREEHDVFPVVKSLGEEAGRQHQQGADQQPPAPASKTDAAKVIQRPSPEREHQKYRKMPQQEIRAGVLQLQALVEQRQGQFEKHAVVIFAVPVNIRRIAEQAVLAHKVGRQEAGHVLGAHHAIHAVHGFVPRHAVVLVKPQPQPQQQHKVAADVKAARIGRNVAAQKFPQT